MIKTQITNHILLKTARGIRALYNDHIHHSFWESFVIHHQNLRIAATEMFRVYMRGVPNVLHEMFSFE